MLGERIKKLILIRLLFATFLLYYPQIFPDASPLVFYGACVAVCALSGFYVLWYVTKFRQRWLAATQILLDVVLETFLVTFSGGVESLFAVFYVLTILSSALILGEKKFVGVTAGVSCAGYFVGSLVVYLNHWNPLVPRDPVYFFYGASVRIAIFIAVGYLSRYLSGTVLELQNRLKLSERLSSLGEVVSKIAHEIRNPLSAIRTAAEVLGDSLQGKVSEQEGRMITIINQESDRLTQTLQRILGYVRQASPNPKTLLLDSLIERCLNLVRLQSQLHPDGVVVEKKYDAVKTRLYVDEEQAVGAFLNLMLNAYQAMPNGGSLKISAQEGSLGTSVDFEDSAGGIPPEKLKDLFVPFKSTKKGGTGLGLAEIHKIVTLHEGKIDVESYEGKGTVFRLFFPKP